MLELSIEHLSGKEAIELTKNRKELKMKILSINKYEKEQLEN